jgi:CHAD domain-containing protein
MYRLETKNYFETLNGIAQKSSIRLDKYLKNPTEENVHDVRIAIRKMESAWIVLPKKIRQKGKIKRFIQTYKKFFKTNSEIRDFDIIQQRLGSIPLQTDQIKELIGQKKKRLMRAAKRQARKSSKVKLPAIAGDDVTPAKLERRFRKVTLGLIESMRALMPTVLSSEERVAELHKLRKDCKKLRYVMELSPTAESSGFVAKLKQMQEDLGLIHDIDITVVFLKKIASKHKIANELVRLELENRSHLYAKFVETHGSEQKQD